MFTPEEAQQRFQQYKDERQATKGAAPGEKTDRLSNYLKSLNPLRGMRQPSSNDNNRSSSSADTEPREQNTSVLDASKNQRRLPSGNVYEEQEQAPRNFLAEQQRAAQTQKDFTGSAGSESDSASVANSDRGQTNGANGQRLPQNQQTADEQVRRNAAYVRAQQTALRAPNNQVTPQNEADWQNSQTTSGSAVNKAMDMASRVEIVLEFFSGVGTFTALLRQAAITGNRLMLHGRINLPGLGGRPAGAYEADPGLRKWDWVDFLILMFMLLGGVVMLFVLFLEALPIIIPIVAGVMGASFVGQQLGATSVNIFQALYLH